MVSLDVLICHFSRVLCILVLKNMYRRTVQSHALLQVLVLLTVLTFTMSQQATCENRVTCFDSCGEDVILCADQPVETNIHCNIISCSNNGIRLYNYLVNLGRVVQFTIDTIIMNRDDYIIISADSNFGYPSGYAWLFNEQSRIFTNGAQPRQFVIESMTIVSPAVFDISTSGIEIYSSKFEGFPFRFADSSLRSVDLIDNDLEVFPRDILDYLTPSGVTNFHISEKRTRIAYYITERDFSTFETLTNTSSYFSIPQSAPKCPTENQKSLQYIRPGIRPGVNPSTARSEDIIPVEMCVVGDTGVSVASSATVASISGGNLITPTASIINGTLTSPTGSISNGNMNNALGSIGNQNMSNTLEAIGEVDLSMESSSTNSSSLVLIVGITVAGVLLIVSVFFISKRKKALMDKEMVKNETKESDIKDQELTITPTSDSGPNLDYINYKKTVNTKSDIPSSEIEVMHRIGTGYYGQVLLAKYCGEYVVVKKQNQSAVEECESFKVEIEMLNKLKHPNIVRYRGISHIVFNKDAELCIVCEYMPKGDLRNVLRIYSDLLGESGEVKKLGGVDTGSTIASEDSFQDDEFVEVLDDSDDESMTLSIPRQNPMMDVIDKFSWSNLKLSIVVDILKGLNYLHNQERKIVHRDLKSPNVLLNNDFTAKISDFGTSREVSLSYTMTVIGSTLWMAPEVISGVKFDEKADIFSFGIVLSELITHQLPYTQLKNNRPGGMHAMAIALQVANEGLRPDIGNASVQPPAFISSLYERCVDKDPSKRLSTHEALDYISQFV